MDNTDFIKASAVLLSQCSPDQRAQLARMAQNFGKSENDTDASGMSMDAKLRSDPERGKSFEERFPDSKRFLG